MRPGPTLTGYWVRSTCSFFHSVLVGVEFLESLIPEKENTCFFLGMSCEVAIEVTK